MINSLVYTLMSNAIVATCLALVAIGLARICRRPAVTHSLWLLVMLKLVTPPFISVPLPIARLIPPMESSAARSPIDHDAGLRAELKPLPQFDGQDGVWADIEEVPSDSQTSPAEPEPDLARAAMPRPGAFARFAEGKPSGEPGQHPARTEPRPPNTTEGHLANLPIDEAPLPPELKIGWNWEPLALMVILAGAVGWWTLAMARIIQFQRLLKDVRPASTEWQSQTDELSARIGLAWQPSLCLVPGRVPPMLWAIGGRPRLLVPIELWTTMASDERTALLLHELAHLKRRDHWIRWLELVVSGLYWWHPVAWWARRALREAEEQCCDAWVISEMPHCRRTYARALLAAVEFVSGAATTPAVASATNGSGHVSCLKRRLQMIVRAKTPKGLSWSGRFAVLTTAALALPLAPGWAQEKRSALIESDRAASVEQKTTEGSGSDQLLKDAELVALVKRINAARSLLNPQSGSTDKFIDGLERQLIKVQGEIDRKRMMLAELRKKGNVVGIKPEGAEQKASADDALDDAFLSSQLQSLESFNDQLKRNLEQVKFEASLQRGAEKQLEVLQQQYDGLRKSKQLVALQTTDDTKGGKDDDKENNARDTAERFQENLKDLVEKLGKELGPVAEEVRRSLEKAVSEVHKSLEKEGLTAEDLGKALDRSQAELRKAFEGGGPVDKELREAIDKAQKDMQQALDRARDDVKDQAETLRDRARGELRRGRDQAEALRDRARDELRRGRDEAERAIRRGGDDAEKSDGDELESARREIRDLEQKLRSATRRLDELQRSRRGPGLGRRQARNSEPNERPREPNAPPMETKPAEPREPSAPRVEAKPEPPRQPTSPTPPSRPARPNLRRPLPPIRPVPGVGRRAPQTENDTRLRELEEKMNRLLKELESLKGEKGSTESKTPSRGDARPTKESSPVTS